MATRYDRLMLAYPRWHRRLHGPDMLTALEDCAAAGRPVSVGRLVLDGIACRLRVRGAGAKLAAACVSVIAAAAMATARHRRLPRSTRSFAMVATVFGACMPIPATLLNLAALASGADSVYLAPPWIGFELFAVRPSAIFGGLGLGLAWLATIIVKGDKASVQTAG